LSFLRPNWQKSNLYKNEKNLSIEGENGLELVIKWKEK